MPAARGRWHDPVLWAAAALFGAIAGASLAEPHRIAASAVLAAAMAAIAFEDLRRLRVPDFWNALAAIAGLGAAWFGAASVGAGPVAAVGAALISMLICAGAFLLLREAFFRLRGVEGLGLGDVKLAATGGIWLGWETFAVAVALAAAGALIWVAVQSASGAWTADRKIPFGAFLAPAIWACWYASELAAAATG
ncbi:MAG TPA: prepilin peptidase [Propylenella sp.]